MNPFALKTCVVIVAELISSIGDVTEDKKVTFGEILSLAPELMKVPSLVAKMPEAISELKTGISDAYLAEIKTAVSAKLNLKNDKAEKIVEVCVNFLVITSSSVFEIKKAMKA
jgi:hypothetical protein